MNLVGEIGNFMMIYQTPIQGVVIVMLLAGGIVATVKGIANARKKRKILEEINQAVSKINVNVKAMSEKEAEVVYIDGKATPESTVSEPTPQVEKAQIPNQERNKSLAEEEKPAVKYFSRDCAVAKDGRRYTVEELNAQIRD